MLTTSFKNKKVLVTGHTGFKGSWLCMLLRELDAEIIGFSLPLSEKNFLFNVLKLKEKINHNEGDIRDFKLLNRIIRDEQPNFIFHLAAQPLVVEGYKKPMETYEVNFMGTLNLLEAIRKSSLNNPNWKSSVVMVTTDKVYHNREWVHPYRETDRLGGHDPYSASKASSELLISSYQNSFFDSRKAEKKIMLSSARAGNVIGGGDFAPFRLIPDIMRSFFKNKKLSIRSKKSTRPWQHVLEPLIGYCKLSCLQYEYLYSNQKDKNSFMMGAYNFGPNLGSNREVADVLEEIEKYLPINWGYSGNNDKFHEAQKLSLSSQKAFTELKWQPYWEFEETIEKTVKWYIDFNNGFAPIEITKRDINDILKQEYNEN